MVILRVIILGAFITKISVLAQGIKAMGKTGGNPEVFLKRNRKRVRARNQKK